MTLLTRSRAQRRGFVCTVSAAVLAVGGTAVPSDAQRRAIIENRGTTLEVLGLRTWTLDMLQDSLRKHGVDLTSETAQACAVVMRYDLKFADAAVIQFSDRKGQLSTLLTVAEPQDSARIKYRDLPLDTLGGSEAWASARRIAKEHPQAFQYAIMATRSRGDSASPRLPPDMWSEWWAIREIWSFLDTHRATTDQATAIAALDREPNRHERQVAAAVLGNFGHDDASWVALSQMMLEREGTAKFTALVVLAELLISARQQPRDWNRVAPSIHAVLDGTSQFLLIDLIEMLNESKMGPELARPFLKGGGTMLLAFAGSHADRAREPALTLLRSLRGKDLGTDVNAWRRWVSSLR